MTRRFHAASLALGRVVREGAAPALAAARRRFGVWGARFAAALRDPEPLTPEDYERELRERVFQPPQF